MDYGLSIDKEITILRNAGVYIDIQKLFDIKVRESITRLGKLLFIPQSEEEHLLFMLDRAITEKLIDKQHLSFQSMLLLLSRHYHITFPESTFNNVKIFCTYIKLRFGACCLDEIRTFTTTTSSTNIDSFGLYSSRSVIRWQDSTIEVENLSIQWLLRFIKDNADSAIAVGKEKPLYLIFTNLMLDGFALNPSTTIIHEKLYGLLEGEVTAHDANYFLHDESKMKDVKLISSINVFCLMNIMNGRKGVCGVTKSNQSDGKDANSRKEEIMTILSNLNVCYCCFEFALTMNTKNRSFEEIMVFAKKICISDNQKPCYRCSSMNARCIKVCITCCSADQGDCQFSCFSSLRQNKDIKNIIFVHDM